MNTQVARWGNSLAVRLPRQVADAAGLAEGATVELEVADGVIRLVPVRRRYSLEELLAGITPENLPDESFDDRPRGRERLGVLADGHMRVARSSARAGTALSGCPGPRRPDLDRLRSPGRP